MKTSLVFFGSGPVAKKSLMFLVEHFEIEAVITKPHTEPEMRSVAGISKVLTATNRTELDQLIDVHRFGSSLGVVVDFGIIVSRQVIDYFGLGIVNSHFSLLPRWRGADPISFAIKSGDQKTGVSLMLIEPELDTGKLLAQKSLAIKTDETTPELTERLIELSNQMLLRYLPLYINGKIKPKAQPHPDRATYSKKLTKSDGRIVWTKPAEVLEREIRAYADWPKSYTELGGIPVIITCAESVTGNGPAGSVSVTRGNLLVFCGQGALKIKSLKPAGKKDMDIAALLSGYAKYLK